MVLAASACRTAVTEVVQSATTLPPTAGWGCESSTPTSQYVASITVGDDGMITAESQNIPGVTGNITLTPTNAIAPGGTIEGWTCAGSIDAKFRPGSCK